jgi:response regulator RpfG family c-di-GMP phosphodiesterase
MIQTAKSVADLRILVAEDESLIALDLEMMLSTIGCEVVGPVGSVDEIVRAAEEREIDGALLDVNLRGRQVFEVISQLTSRGIPVVLTSGYDDSSLFPPAFRHLPRISKPFNETALRRVCATIFLTGPAS